MQRPRRPLPSARIRVRHARGFCTPPLLLALPDLRVEYVIGLAGNVVLLRRSKAFLRGLRKQVKSAGEAGRRSG